MASILVVDDESIVREPIAASLRAKGHTVECAADAAAALNLATASPPDLILLDVHMPQRGGLEFLKDLRSSAATFGTPVVLLSTATERATIIQAAKLGIQGYILKSAFSLPELLVRIESLTASLKTTPAVS